jgi:hypothetical protein
MKRESGSSSCTGRPTQCGRRATGPKGSRACCYIRQELPIPYCLQAQSCPSLLSACSRWIHATLPCNQWWLVMGRLLSHCSCCRCQPGSHADNAACQLAADERLWLACWPAKLENNVFLGRPAVLLCRPKTLPLCVQHGCWALSVQPALLLHCSRREPTAGALACSRAGLRLELGAAAGVDGSGPCWRPLQLPICTLRTEQAADCLNQLVHMVHLTRCLLFESGIWQCPPEHVSICAMHGTGCSCGTLEMQCSHYISDVFQLPFVLLCFNTDTVPFTNHCKSLDQRINGLCTSCRLIRSLQVPPSGSDSSKSCAAPAGTHKCGCC